MVTVGVAIEIPEPYGSQLRQARLDCGDPLAATVPSHVTLAPPLEIDEPSLDSMFERLSRAAAALPPFAMRLRGTGTFRPVSPVVFVAVSLGISYTEMLAARISALLDLPPTEFPFHPHVTIAHHVSDEALDSAYAALADFECQFQVEQFAFYLHDEVAGWVPERHFVLGQG